jgi:NTP pyrophosphatase (non-canonical NTP hydrolase)
MRAAGQFGTHESGKGNTMTINNKETAMGVEAFEANVVRWATDRNIIGGTQPKDQMLKLVEEFGELSTGLQKKNDFYIEDAIGDCAVVLCIIAAQCGMSFGKCLESAWDEIKDRRGQVVNGVFVKETT